MSYSLMMEFIPEEKEGFDQCPIIEVAILKVSSTPVFYSREDFLKNHPKPLNPKWIYIGINLIVTSDLPITVPSWQHSFMGGLQRVSKHEDISSDASRVVGSTYPDIGWKIDSAVIKGVIDRDKLPNYYDEGKEVILLDDTFYIIESSLPTLNLNNT